MNKPAIIAVTLGLVLALLAAGAFVVLRKQNTPATTTGSMMQDQATTMNSNDEGTRGSLKDLMSLAQNQECSFVDSESKSEGTVFVAQGNMRGDFEVTSETGTLVSHVIVKNDEMYLWMDDAEDGFKTTLSAVEDAAEEISESSPTYSNSVDLNQDVDYSCKPWAGDNSKFVLPSNVTFEDFAAMMEEVSGSMQGELNVSCEACDNLPAGDAQTQCKTALGC
ncbi:hypothetical protein A2801_03025 [Candidatus Woesebacteria bacterium RIFCSPHIGHO2_01_FULL_41_10]|uniref:Uncharacterized protein n=1 Tax=Candidatus Woesebacteria bacterium RIFCSPHIGHO2_01_FULL_41_10 TaxID=1802500 RepID=A0A1F7YNP6_9BACT|nr:MAG: hypothetical protein A2801_03025 [Candidatus Woesebacteria bacterium RIFCSPHIGHO2_01_FULL_41_10]